jgi:hypothetical protein
VIAQRERADDYNKGEKIIGMWGDGCSVRKKENKESLPIRITCTVESCIANGRWK